MIHLTEIKPILAEIQSCWFMLHGRRFLLSMFLEDSVPTLAHGYSTYSISLSAYPDDLCYLRISPGQSKIIPRIAIYKTDPVYLTRHLLKNLVYCTLTLQRRKGRKLCAP